MKTKGRSIYVISDTHFGHENMVKWSLRPKNFNEKLEKGFRSLPKNSILIHCGDLALGGDYRAAQLLHSLPYKKILVRGNHDKHSISWYIDNGWDVIVDEMVLEIYGHKILFSHLPLPKRETCTINVHGHLHGGKSRVRPDFYDESYHKEVCPEVVGYTPVKLCSVV